MKLDEIVDPAVKKYKEEQAVILADAIEKIKADCQPFLNECGGKFLYRGMKKGIQYFTRRQVRMDRKPESSSKFVHNVMDEWLHKKFGIKARSTTVFTTADFQQSAGYSGGYGGAYAIFPIGDFKFVWSEKLYDPFMQMQDVMFDKEDERYPDDILGPKVEAFLEKSKYRDDNLPAAIASGNEVMIECKEYYAFWVETKQRGNAFAKKLLA